MIRVLAVDDEALIRTGFQHLPDNRSRLRSLINGGGTRKGNVKQRPAAISARLTKLTAEGYRDEGLWLWEGFAQALAAECKPKPSAS